MNRPPHDEQVFRLCRLDLRSVRKKSVFDWTTVSQAMAVGLGSYGLLEAQLFRMELALTVSIAQ